jgi:preprotein translocase subunit YajC
MADLVVAVVAVVIMVFLIWRQDCRAAAAVFRDGAD